MTTMEFKNVKVGTKVEIADNSKYKGQIGTVLKTYKDIPGSTQLTVHNDFLGSRKFSYKNLKLL